MPESVCLPVAFPPPLPPTPTPPYHHCHHHHSTTLLLPLIRLCRQSHTRKSASPAHCPSSVVVVVEVSLSTRSQHCPPLPERTLLLLLLPLLLLLLPLPSSLPGLPVSKSCCAALRLHTRIARGTPASSSSFSLPPRLLLPIAAHAKTRPLQAFKPGHPAPPTLPFTYPLTKHLEFIACPLITFTLTVAFLLAASG